MKHKITVVGLGPGDIDELTLGALKALKQGSQVLLRTEQHSVARYLKEQGIGFHPLDALYLAENFDEVYRKMVEKILSMAEKGDVVLGVPGHPLVGERLTLELIHALKNTSQELVILPGISRADELLALIGQGGVDGLHLVPASEVIEALINPRLTTVILDIHSRILASELKLLLLKFYPNDLTVYLSSEEAEGQPIAQKLSLHQLDHNQKFDHTSCLYIPAVPFEALHGYDFSHLTEIMALLRAPEGCPWDREQDHESLKQYLIEEAYEVLEAIDLKDGDKLLEELGDLLLQVVFHAQVAKEHGEFDIMDVTTRICRKMIDRHTHIFGNAKADTAKEVVSNWEAIKKQEKGLISHTQVLKDIPSNLPALMRGYKVQKKAALAGFDWDLVEDALLKVDEELAELRAIYQKGIPDETAGELGDLLFAVVNVARFLDVQPELALTTTTEKFIKRFEYIEKHADRPLETMTLDEMDVLWNQAKSVFLRDQHV